MAVKSHRSRLPLASAASARLGRIWWYPDARRNAEGDERGSRLAEQPPVQMPNIPNVVQPGKRRNFFAYLAHSIHRHWQAGRHYFSTRTNDLAVVVAFNGLVAIVPMFLLVVAIAGVLLRSDGMLYTFERTVISIFPSANARTALQDAVATRQNAGWFSILSLIGFVWIGSSFVATITRAINNLYNMRGHPFVHSRVRGFVVILVFSVLLMIAVLAGTLPTLIVGREVPPAFADLFVFRAVVQVLSYISSFVTAFLLFVLAYRFLPSIPQRILDVVPGALVAATGLLILTQVFPIYVRIYQNLPSSSSYGAAFVFVSILVTWSYLLAHVLLIGAWLNARAEDRRRARQRLQLTRVEQDELARELPAHRQAPHDPPPIPIDRP